MIPLSCPSTFFVQDNFYTDGTDQDLREALVFVQEIQDSHRTKPRVGLKGSPLHSERPIDRQVLPVYPGGVRAG